MEVLPSDNNAGLHFQALRDMCAEINVRIANSIFANHERARLDMKKQAEDISKKYGYFDEGDSDYDDKPLPDDVSIKQESDIEIDNASIKEESDNEINGKKYKEPQLETAAEIEKQAVIDEDKFIKIELEVNKVDLEASKEAKIKKIQDIFEEVTQEELLKDIENFFIDDDDIFDNDEITEGDKKLIMNLIDRTTFTADTKKFIEDNGSKNRNC